MNASLNVLKAERTSGCVDRDDFTVEEQGSSDSRAEGGQRGGQLRKLCLLLPAVPRHDGDVGPLRPVWRPDVDERSHPVVPRLINEPLLVDWRFLE